MIPTFNINAEAPSFRIIAPLPLGEGPDRGGRGSKPLNRHAVSNYGTPHPPLRVTFSLWKKDKCDAPIGEWV